ncbi:ThiF family adenylyltransferase [Pelagibius sp. 7325]|uniref:ThiF family adenylyltransferase n=1 Tax=Pelagibius sp. 7325 TaxID=3131994 RepID=UPI0030EE455E
MSGANFDYEEAFDRNIGWVTADEQRALSAKRVAIAGMGGVGGAHLLTLARMGIGAFNISDLDSFELANFNRQAGASISSLNRPKVDVMAQMAEDINPQLDIKAFPEGINDANIDAFLKDVDLFVDGFDFFVPDIRAKVFRRCAQLGIPAITAGPIGFGTSYIVFLPGRMSFEQYFRMEGLPKESQYARFLLGLTPKGLHRDYLVDPSRLNLVEKKGPSSAAAVQLCAGVVGGEAVKILLGRGRVRAAPYFHQFDVYRGKFVCQRLFLGNANPLQRLKLKMVERHIAATLALADAQKSGLPEDATELERILDLARWAPSGDNSQPWRFEILDGDNLRIHLRAQTDEDIYDYNDGQPTLLSGGMLLETMRIAASAYGRLLTWSHEESDGLNHRIAVSMVRSPVTADPLLAAVKSRSVDRGAYHRRRLGEDDKAALTAALGDDLRIHWHETFGDRLALARLNARATDIRLRIREAFQVHRRVIDWSHDLSPTGIPAKAVGLDAMTLKIMRWGFGDWRRLERMNAMPGSTGPAILQMDILPAVHSAALFTIRSATPPAAGRHDPETLLRFGCALQRFWLTAEQRGLGLQPALATAIFAHYGRHDIDFTPDEKIRAKAKGLADELNRRGLGADDLVFLGRIGRAKRRLAYPRSIRRPLSDLLMQPAADADSAPHRHGAASGI